MKKLIAAAVAGIAFVFLGFFLLYPLFGILSASFLDASGAHLTFNNYAKVIARAFYRDAVTNSLTIGVLATVRTRGTLGASGTLRTVGSCLVIRALDDATSAGPLRLTGRLKAGERLGPGMRPEGHDARPPWARRKKWGPPKL